MSVTFSTKIEQACSKKEKSFDTHRLQYTLKCIFAGAFLTMSTAGGAFAAEKISHIHPDLSKFTFSFLFAWGLIYILFLNAELSTSNMMYLTAGVYLKSLRASKALKILLYCTFFNLIGAILSGALFGLSSAFTTIDAHSFITEMVTGKLIRENLNIILEGVIANVFVNVAILSYLLIDNASTKMCVVLSCVFLFVYLGTEHVVANFASFSIVRFTAISNMLSTFDWLNLMRHILFAFIGNYIGGGIIVGIGYTMMTKE